MLSFIKFLKQNSRSLNHFVSRIREGRWLKTSHGRRSPVGRVLYNEEWKIARQISKIPFIDEDEYGKEIHSFKPKLQLLGVIIDFGGNYQMVVDNILSSFLSSLTAENGAAFYRKLKRTSHKFPSRLTMCIRKVNWLRTRLGGYRSPGSCILYGPEWESICPFTLLPFNDESDNFYGKGIHEYKKELKKMGIVLEVKGIHALLFFVNEDN
ncbi:hypothetical protein H0E87_022151 [Populus deltoides]|uniref:Uncharacterized protein n=1 Tax=Populus deltoides TaxID=3696 RepID=A0A8T2XI25_POPDE|nr:hypothetical protein H0E87_022151 [Populus deltoides]